MAAWDADETEYVWEDKMKKKGWTMRKAILVFCIGCVLSALFLQTLLFQESLRRQIRFESITDNENTLTKMQSELSSIYPYDPLGNADRLQ